MDIEIEFRYWACVIKYINTTANFWMKNEKYEAGRSSFRVTKKLNRDEKQAEMVMRELETNHSTKKMKKKMKKRTRKIKRIHQQRKCGHLKWISNN